MYTRNILRLTTGISEIRIGHKSVLKGVYLSICGQPSNSLSSTIACQVGMVNRGVIFSTEAEYPGLLATLDVGVNFGIATDQQVSERQFFPMEILVLEGDVIYFRVSVSASIGSPRNWMILYLEPED